MTPREIAALFMEMEQRLIASLKRNLSRHRKWEQEEGFSWPAWQAEKIRSLESYRRQNRKIIAEYRPVIDAATARLLYDQYEEGYGEETEALEQLLGPEPEKKAQTLPKAPPGESEFFGTDKAKMDALIEDINATFHKAESATFRMMDDVYRRTIYRAETALSGGTDDIWKAVDMATADFLRQGITCIRYKNGRLVNIASYAEMALRTAATRAKLRGEAAKRRERGLDTVLVSQYGACSETCLPWQGRAYIDDVWGGFTGETDGRGRGLSKDGSWYPLLSTALEGGLFHPNCRHTLVDWKKGVTREPEALDRETCLKKSRLEQQQRAMERKVRKYKRLQEGTLDPEKAKEYGRKVREAQGELREFIREHGDVFSRKYQREKNRGPASIQQTEQYKMMFPWGKKEPASSSGGNASQVIESAVKTMEQDFPILKKYPVPQEFKVLEPGNPGQATIDIFPDGTVQLSVAFNQEMWDNIDSIRALVEQEARTGAHTASLLPESVVYHEYGHVLHQLLSLKRAGWDGKSRLSLMQTEIYRQEYFKITQEIYLAAFTDEGYEEIQQIIGDQLGQRALENQRELIAECFAAHYSGLSSTVASSIVRYFRKSMKGR